MNGDCDVINRLLNETMHMDFPFLAGEDKKKRIVEDNIYRRYNKRSVCGNVSWKVGIK